MLFIDVYICNKSIKANIEMINNTVNIIITSSLGRKEGNEIKMCTKEGTFNSTCIISLKKKKWLNQESQTVKTG